MALLIDNALLASLPASVSPIPSEILTGVWQFKLEPGASSASIAYQFGYIGLFGYSDDNKIALIDNGGGVARIDVYSDGGGQRQIGQISWDLGAVFLFEIDVPASTVTVTILEGTATFGGGWDSSNATTATRVQSAWTWGGGPALAVGGFPGLFELDGTILDVADAAGPDVTPVLEPGGLAADGGYGTQSATVTGGPSGIAATNAYGTANAALGVAHSGIAPADAYGAPQAAVTGGPGGIAPDGQLGAPVAHPRATAGGLAPADVYGTATATVVTGNTGIAPAERYGTATIEEPDVVVVVETVTPRERTMHVQPEERIARVSAEDRTVTWRR